VGGKAHRAGSANDSASAGKSPDRADALVWALTELLLGKGGAGNTPRVRWI
jgi:phage terminase large subunit-like protein